MAVIGHW